VDNTFYFPGWSVYIDGKQTDIQYQDPDYRGIITFNVPMSQHNIEVKFGKTKVRKFADYISIGFLTISFIGLIISRKKNKV
ncbi:MAG: hypothetical protein KKA76_15420, partial [Proteobacteria bacterium]|nr:hypothetical protein [Pseudomonadota bacterium]